jgi:hypothetical protein
MRGRGRGENVETPLLLNLFDDCVIYPYYGNIIDLDFCHPRNGGLGG